MGDPDPTNLINAETNRIPFRAKNFSLDLWKDTFRSWPSSTKGWKDWFLRVSKTNEVYWGERKIDQCVRLSIANMLMNESMLIAASYFWSDTFNAFIFRHGPASPHAFQCGYAYSSGHCNCRLSVFFPREVTPTSEFVCMLPFPDGDAKRHTKIYPGSGKRRPYVQRGGGRVCIILHLSACTGVNTSVV